MTNGDFIRSKMSDDWIANNFCGISPSGYDCDHCPLEKINNCFDHNLRLNWLRSEREEVESDESC